jgi:hypothetical protein
MTWEEELQLLFVKDGDEATWDDVVESLQEGGQLLPVAGQETATRSHVIPDTYSRTRVGGSSDAVKHIS